MQKLEMRIWVSTLEELLNKKLKKWKCESRIENGEAVQVEWQYEQTHIILDIFWEDAKEGVSLNYFSPRASHRFHWDGLNDRTFDKIEDRIGNLAQSTMYPPLEATDHA